MKKIINLIMVEILQSNKKIISFFLLVVHMNIYTQEIDSLNIENVFSIELNENNSRLYIALVNKTTDTLAISNLYHFDNPSKISYLNFYWYNDNEKKYNQGGLINTTEEPFFLLNNQIKSRLIKIPPKTKNYYPIGIGYFSKIKIFLEIQTIVRYQNKNYFIKTKTNEIKIE